jgi:hypothetical protein
MFQGNHKEDVIHEVERGELYQLLCHCITFPKALYAPDPEYSEAARKSKFEGDVLLGVIVGPTESHGRFGLFTLSDVAWMRKRSRLCDSGDSNLR